MDQQSAEKLNSSSGLPSDRWFDLRMISGMRLVLASCAMLIILIDSAAPDRLVWLTYTLILYTLYSSAIYILSRRGSRLLPQKTLHWLDLIWYVPMIAFSGGTNSFIIIFFFFFSILAASFGWGFSAGLRMTIASAVLFTAIGLLAPTSEDIQLNRFLLRMIFLVALGYMISHWGGFEVKLKGHLGLLKDISNLSNPRFNTDQTIAWIMEHLRRFYNADSCLLVLAGSDRGHFQLHKVTGGGAGESTVKDIPDQMAAILLSPSPPVALFFHKKASKSRLYDVKTSASSNEVPSSLATIGNTLEAESFLSLPVYYRSRAVGRLYIIGSSQSFEDSDIAFVRQLIEHVTPLLDNIRLVDRLASEAAEYERQRIARDIHDGVIQPYIGLQLGLAAIRQKLDRGDTDVSVEVRELSEMTVSEIDELRHYIRGLKKSERHDTMLVPAIRRFASKFSAATGIAVEVKATENIAVKDRFAAEIFQMVTEGFSNIRRHTLSPRAEAELDYRNGILSLHIRNENANGSAELNVHPRSLEERATALGGQVEVSVDDKNRTVVSIRIPL